RDPHLIHPLPDELPPLLRAVRGGRTEVTVDDHDPMRVEDLAAPLLHLRQALGLRGVRSKHGDRARRHLDVVTRGHGLAARRTGQDLLDDRLSHDLLLTCPRPPRRSSATSSRDARSDAPAARWPAIDD